MIMLLLLKKPAWLVRITTKAASQLKNGRNFDVQWLCVGLDPGEPEPGAGCQVQNAFVPERCRVLPRAPERCSVRSNITPTYYNSSSFHLVFHYPHSTPNILYSGFHFLFHYPWRELGSPPPTRRQPRQRGSRMAQAFAPDRATSLRHSRWFAVGFRVLTGHNALDRCAKSLSKGRHACRHAILVKSFEHAGPFAVKACMRS